MTKKDNLLKGFFKENPIFVYLLGMCPALAVTASFETSLGMGLLVIFVLTLSNIVVSLLRNLIPNDVRTPAYIVIIATFVTVVGMLSHAFALELYDALGVFIPLIVVNCLILGRAESFASKNKVIDSAIDGIGMGLGFTFALVVIGIVRELLATGGIMYGVYLPFFVDAPITLFSLDMIINLFAEDFVIADYALNMFAIAPGAFIALGIILSVIQGKKARTAKKLLAEKQRLIAEKKKAALAKKAAMAKKNELAKEAA
jgi:electron transport complex protein RnfE